MKSFGVIVLCMATVLVFAENNRKPVYSQIRHQRETVDNVLRNVDKITIKLKSMNDDSDSTAQPTVEKSTRMDSKPRLKKKYVGDNYFPRYDEIESYIVELVKSNNSILSYFTIGKSYEGREIICAKISTGTKPDGTWKPGILIDGGIHAREWLSVTSAMYVIVQLAEKRRVINILENLDIYIVPVLNPDGYEYSHEGAGDEYRMWRKSRAPTPDSSCTGVDLNRNFGIKWNTVGVTGPCEEAYPGNSTFSEPESRALAEFLVIYKRIFKVYISLHTYGSYILYPWSFSAANVKNKEKIKCTAKKAVEALSGYRRTPYFSVNVGSSPYPTSGMTMDYAMALGGVDLDFTIELPNPEYGFKAPQSEIKPVGEEFFGALKVFARYVKGEVCNNY